MRAGRLAASSVGHRRDPRVDRRLPRPVRVHLPHGGQEPAGGLAARLLAAQQGWDFVGEPRRGASRRATSSLVRAFVNSTILTVAQRRDHGGPRRDGRLRAAAAPSRWNPLINFLVLAGLIVPPAVVPTIWVLQSLGLFKTMPGLILIEVDVRAVVLHPAVPRVRRDHPEGARRGGDASTAPVPCGCSSRSCCRCCGP